MGYYYVSIICENGHLISERSNGDNTNNKFCCDCGAKTISSCPSCHTPIRGTYKVDGVCDLTYDGYVPMYCHNCGKPYPWTVTALESVNSLIKEDENLSDNDKQQFCETLPDLLVEVPTPKTKVAAVRFKKFLHKVASYTADGIREIFTDIASETIKKTLGL